MSGRAALSSLVWSAPQFGNLCIRNRPPPLRVTPQVEDCLHAFDLVFDHRLRPGAVHLEAQDPEVRLRTELSVVRSEEHTSELQSRLHLVCRLLLEKKKKKHYN